MRSVSESRLGLRLRDRIWVRLSMVTKWQDVSDQSLLSEGVLEGEIFSDSHLGGKDDK